MNTEFNFPTDGGPVITGRWYNPNTNDIFTARDSFFQDNQLLIQTTDGRVLDYNTIQNYVKVDDKFQAPAKQSQPKQSQLPPEVAAITEINDNDILEEDMSILQGRQVTQQAPIDMQPIFQAPEKSDDRKLVERLLNRAAKPEIKCSIKWDKYPQKQIDCLLDMMGVDPEEIIKYYIDNINMSDIKESIERELIVFCEEHLGDMETEADIKEQELPLPSLVVKEEKHVDKVVKEPKKVKKETKKPTKEVKKSKK